MEIRALSFSLFLTFVLLHSPELPGNGEYWLVETVLLRHFENEV
jgi:hypothetical protein